MNFYAFLADLMVFIHLLYMGFVVFGQLAIMIGWPLGWKWIRNPWFRGVHLGMILIVVVEAVAGITCPLTTWEDDLRELAGQKWVNRREGYADVSFTGRMMRNIQFAAQNHWEDYIDTVFYIAGGVIIATVFLVPPRLRRSPPPLAVTHDAEPATTSSSVTAVKPGATPGRQPEH